MFDATKDYYAILGVAKDASLEEIKKAHVKLALENHPDMLALEDRDNSLVNDGGERFRNGFGLYFVGFPRCWKEFDG